MAENTLTGLIPDLYAALNKVSRELVGYVPSVSNNMDGTTAAVGEDIVIPIAPTANVGDITPSMTLTEPTGQVITNTTITITKSRAAEFGFVAEDQRGLDNGPGHLNIQAQMIAQAMRSLVNEVEVDVAATVLDSTTFYGVPGTTPFVTTLADTAQLRKVLEDNGAWVDGSMSLVIDTSAAANMRTLTNLTHANEANSEDMLRRGVLTNVHGFDIRSSGQVASFTGGDAAGATTNTAGYAIGITTINLASAGTGEIKAGDIITFAGDTTQYEVETGDADVSGGGVIELISGLEQAIPGSATAITVQGTYAANGGFERNAIQLITRAPALPKEGDARMDSMVITDALSGLSFEVSVWGGNRKVKYEIALAWGVANIKPSHVVKLLG